MYRCIHSQTGSMRWLLIQSDYQGNEKIRLDLTGKHNLIIGTDLECDLVVDKELYPSISKKHAVLEFHPSTGQAGNWILNDNNSTNGTYVNHKRLTTSHMITQSDTISLSIDCLKISLLLVDKKSEGSLGSHGGEISTLLGEEKNASLNERPGMSVHSHAFLALSSAVGTAGDINASYQHRISNGQNQMSEISPNPNDQASGLPDLADAVRDVSPPVSSPQRLESRFVRPEPLAAMATLLETGCVEQECTTAKANVRAIAVDSLTKRLIVATSESITIKCLDSGSIIHEQENDRKKVINIIRFSRDGQKIALGLRDKTICVIDCTMKRDLLVLRGHTRALSDISFSPDGQHLATSGLDKTIRIWNLESESEERIITYQGINMQSIDYDPSGDYILAGGRDRIIRRLNPASGDSIDHVAKLSSGVELIRLSKPRTLAVVCSDKTIRFAQIDEPAVSSTKAHYSEEKNMVAICNHCRLFAHVEAGTLVHVWTLSQ